MGISRFEQFAPVDFSEMPISAPDVAMIDSMLGQFQGEYDQGVSKFSEANFKNLGADAITAQQLRQAQNQMVDDISDKYVKGVGEGRQAMSQGLRDLTRDYKEGGQRYAINKNYESFMAQRDELQKRVGKGEEAGGITQKQMEAWEQYTLGNFGQKGGTKADEYGIWGSIAMDDVAKHVNGNLRALELGKGWIADKMETGSWFKKNDELYKKTVKGEEKVTFDEMMDELVPSLYQDSELMNYLTQFSEHTGEPIDLQNIRTKNKDGSYTYNTDNPIVSFAQLASRKYSYLNTKYDEDIKFDDFHKQRLDWGREDEKERLQNLMDTTTHLGQATTKADVYETAQDARTAISKYDSDIATYSGQLKDKNLTPTQRQTIEENIYNLTAARENLNQAYMEAVGQVAPEYTALLNTQEATLNKNGIDQSLHNTAMDAVTRGLTSVQTISGGRTGKDTTYKHVRPLGADNVGEAAAIYAKATGISQQEALMIVGNEMTKTAMQPRVDKAVKTKIDVSLKDNAIAQVMISVDKRDTYEHGQKKGMPTAKGKLVRQLRTNMEGFTFSHDGVGVHDGSDFQEAMQGEYGGKFEWDKIDFTDYVPGSDYMQDGRNMKGNSKGTVSVPYTDANGSKKLMTFKMAFTDETKRFENEIENDILEYSIDEDSKRAIQVKHARNNKPAGSFARMETNNQNEVTIPGPLQHGQDPRKLNPGVKLKVVQGNSKGKPKSHIVEAGDYSVDFGTDYEEAERYADRIMFIGQRATEYKTPELAISEMWNYLERQPDNYLTKEELTSIITHFKAK